MELYSGYVNRLVSELAALPGIGDKSAQRLAFHMINMPPEKVKRLAEGKKITVSDERFFKLAEDSLYGELAISLGLEKDKVRDYVTERIDHEEMIPVV